MKRNQVVFLVIITLALGVVFISQLISGLDGGGSGATSDGQPTPPPEGSVIAVVQSHNTKEVWMERMESEFNAQNFKLSSGERIIINVEQTGSPLRESLEPVAWSPSDQIRVDEVNQDYRDRTNRPLITQACPATVTIPVGIAMWRPMAEFLGWPNADIRWQDIIDLALIPDGWADPAYGNPQWGRFRYGHGHPEYSSSGRLSVVAQTYAATGKTEGLTVQDVNSPAVRDAVGAIQKAIVHYGRIDTDLLNKMTLRGPSYLHAVTNYESNVVRWNLERSA